MKYIMITEPKNGQKAKARFNSNIVEGKVIVGIHSPHRLHIDLHETVVINVACPHWNLVYTEEYKLDNVLLERGMWNYRLVRDLGIFGFGHRFSSCHVKGLVVSK